MQTSATAYFASAHRIRAEALLAALFALLTSLAQRTLSTQVRAARREGADAESARPAEISLKLLSAALPILAAALLGMSAARPTAPHEKRCTRAGARIGRPGEEREIRAVIAARRDSRITAIRHREVGQEVSASSPEGPGYN